MENIIQLTLEEYNEMRDGFLTYQKSQRICIPSENIAERDTTHDECIKENQRLCKIRGEQDEEIHRLKLEIISLKSSRTVHPYYPMPYPVIYGGVWSGSINTTNQGDFDKTEGNK